MTSGLHTTTDDLYAVLSISRSASADEIRKAYRRQALLLHPDKHSSSSAEERKKTTQKFQQVSFAYAVLSDEKKRDRYDRTGSVEDLCLDDGDAEALAKYFEELYRGMVTKEKINEFQEKYIGSVEERGDVLNAYVKRKGDMNLILSDVPFSNCDSEPRLLELIGAAISAGQVPSFPKHATTNTEEARRKRRVNEEKEAKAAEKAQKEMEKSKEKQETGGKDGTAELQQLLQQRGQKRLQNLVESLEAKYGKKGKSSGRKGKEKARDKKDVAKKAEEDEDGWDDDAEEDSAMTSEPTEEEFKAIQERLFNKSVSENGGGVNKKARKSSKVPKDSTATGTRRSARNKK